jgi:ABC-type nitrate/sulfonate/bicarbonate transport system ATPase subunit
MSRAGVHKTLDVSIKRKAYRSASGESLDVLNDVVFRLSPGEVGAIVGPSGCGKTTLLRIIAGLDAEFDGDVTRPASGKLGFVFQEPRLLPWRSVADNVRLAAPAAGDDEIDALFAMLGLDEHRDHYPGELSGGLARRVSLARAFAVSPDLLVLDEPFVSLDAALAAHLRGELAALVARKPVTTLLVTHDIDEAIGLADRIFLLSPRPARIVGEVRIPEPRGARGARVYETTREAIARLMTRAPA